MSIYVISDIHSCLDKFLSAVPRDAKKIILLGDLFNKGRTQKEMFSWVMRNKHNPKYVFVRGNAELRCNNEIVRKFVPNMTKYYFDWFGSNMGYQNKNIANVVIELIENGNYEVEDVLDLFQNIFKWYHIEDDWIMSHAAWEFNKLPTQQNKLNLCYDVNRMLPSLLKHDYQPRMLSMYANKRFVFGHTPVYHIKSNAKPPIILKNRFFFIDNAIFKTVNPVFFLKIK